MFLSGDWAIAAELGSEAEATLMCGFLESHGLDARVETLAFRQEPVNFGSLSIVRVRVPNADLERARSLLAERDRFSLVPNELADDSEDVA